MLVNGYQLNHTALSVHNIKGRSGDIYAFADELVMKGFNLNNAGGIMKVGAGSIRILICTDLNYCRDCLWCIGQDNTVVQSGAWCNARTWFCRVQYRALAVVAGG